jgi:phosphoglycolate phosphatase-like HAD superfamily hydrolase
MPSWNDGAAKRAILDFVERVTAEGGGDFVPRAERVAVFDNDGTLWCEKPMPVELGFVLKRLRGMAESDAELREEQPWKAAYERDYAWLGDVVTRHYHGDDSGVKLLFGAMLRAFDGMTVDDYADAAHAFLHDEQHPTLGRSFRDTGYLPMVELLGYLEANGFATYIASGGDRDFMRPVTEVDHDDDQREFAYAAGAEQALERAAAQGWTVVSVKDDWSTVFADLSGT